MKKKLLFFLFLFLAVSYSKQTLAQVNIGAFTGLNSSKFVGDAPKNANYKGYFGLNAGLLVDVALSEYFSLGIQPSYSQEGSRVFYTVSKSESPVDSIHVRLNCFSIPILFKALTNNKHFYAIGGIEYAFILDSYEKSGEIKNEIPTEVSDWNLALHFGAGAKISVGHPNLLLELRYTQGIVNLTDSPSSNASIPRVKTTGFKFLVGIEIPLKKQSN